VKLVELLRHAGIRGRDSTSRNEKINYKVREHSVGQGAADVSSCGMREAEEGTVSVRRLGSEGQKVQPFMDAMVALMAEATAPDLKADAKAA
jgi:threonyl-tRNA synthetase